MAAVVLTADCEQAGPAGEISSGRDRSEVWNRWKRGFDWWIDRRADTLLPRHEDEPCMPGCSLLHSRTDGLAAGNADDRGLGLGTRYWQRHTLESPLEWPVAE